MTYAPKGRAAFGGAVVALLAAVAQAWAAPPARAAEQVTYEVASDSIPMVDVDFVQPGGQRVIAAVPLPWRMDVSLDDPHGPTGHGAQLRADWRPLRGPAKWVTIRIFSNGELLCQSTLDVGNATCYGNTPHFG
ncbi:hypothetical protein ACQI4L_03220 [Mycolicibacterium litorale]|uniref:hypothetical protein n=1 Tax=Mycolicibacterium litorale TaxID=758802 RepID=UPI003CE774C3